jgi:ribonuclease R
MNIKEVLVGLMREKGYRPLKKQELAKIFDINKYQRKDFYKLIDQMEKEGYILKSTNDKYGLPENMGYIKGKVQMSDMGYAFLIPEDKNLKDLFIGKEATKSSMDGDTVLAMVIREATEDKRAEGKIIKILERANKTIVGKFQQNTNFGFVVPESKKLKQDIYVANKKNRGAKNNQVVVVEIEKWPEEGRKPEGRIVQILGYMSEPGVDVEAIIKQFNLPEDFPKEVHKESKKVEEVISEDEIKRRLDLRSKKIFTIDGKDAKDLDDAISIEKLEDGNYLLGVHIADVTHYVKERSALDVEALNRGTSIYLVDRVIPMLPKKLSNGVCSLNPNVDRLTLSVLMTITPQGKVVSHDIKETIICSVERLNYTDISNLLENDDEQLKMRYDNILEDLYTAEKLAAILRSKREQRGAIDFDFDEAKVILGERGKVASIDKYDRRVANRMIEEFMLVCNETVSEAMFWTETPFLYRIHEDPDDERMNVFIRFINNFGYTIKGIEDGEIHPKELQKILDQVKGKREEAVINTLMLRSLKKARYSSVPEGHFGLSAEYYSHFTSPIRRYPDLQIHRIIKEFINAELNTKRDFHYRGILPKVAEQSSTMERRAEEAERESVKMKMAEYMKSHIGEEYEGIISGVTSFGLFVELDNTIEGLVHVNKMPGYYVFDEVEFALYDENSGKEYKLGDTIRIRVAGADVTKREIDFVIVESE